MGIAENPSRTGGRELDFLVIGVQKGGTTSLWEYLRGHPRIAMPAYKELPVFCAPEGTLDERLAELMCQSFSGAPADALLGMVSTHCMMGLGEVGAEQVAARIATRLPALRLIALLRDPVERAASHYLMSVRRGLERRSFEVAVGELIEPGPARRARERPTETNSYLVQGEYGRIVGIYRERFPATRIHILPTADLASDAGAALDRVLAFLGLPPGYRPPGLGERHHRGGARARLGPEGLASLRGFMEAEIWPLLGERDAVPRRSFEFFLETWNTIPDDERPALPRPLRERLREHYRRDAGLLAELGVAAPWLGVWDPA